MEAPLSKFIHVQQPDTFWHQTPGTSSFKSPDLIELNSDSEKKPEPEQVNYSSSQEEVETEDDCGDAPATAILGKDGLSTVYDVTSNDEESCHLLQTEDDSENSDSEHENSSKSSNSRSSSSAGGTISEGENVPPTQEDRARSVNNDLREYWAMTPEQDSYYTTQFLKLQPDLAGIISGNVAKVFFEKSKLNQVELREIWQVADVTQDGNLDLIEFKTAMHLVVLRRHGMPLPPKGFTLKVKEQNHDTPDFTRGQDSSLYDVRGISRPSIKLRSQRNHILKKIDAASNDNDDDIRKPTQEEWTRFDNEPVNFSSRCDTSGLVAPVPVRLTPEDSLFLSSVTPSGNKVHQHLQLKSIQRPKLSGHQPKASLGTIAPPPPPRRKTHVRSSSLDLNRLGINASLDSSMPPKYVLGPDMSGRSFLSPANGGAFSVYRKPNKLVLGTESRSSLASYDKQELMQLRQEVVELKNDNVILAGITTQLLDQLSGLEAKRGELKTQIQHWLSLRPPASNYTNPLFKDS